ncbi:DUF5333 family protein [Salipiger mucosus]|nr:DUF5333 family protein [Salipiger mucosus]
MNAAVRISAGATLAAVLLAGCGPAGGSGGTGVVGAPPATAPLADRWAHRVVAISVAEGIADKCYGEGISLAPSQWNGAVARATGELVAQGADPAELDAIYAAHDFNETSAQAQAWLAARGAVPGVPESLCTIGEREIADGTEVGRLLQTL